MQVDNIRRIRINPFVGQQFGLYSILIIKKNTYE